MNVFGVEIELLLLDPMVFMLHVMAYLSLDLIQFSKIFRGIRSAEIKFPNSHACVWCNQPKQPRIKL